MNYKIEYAGVCFQGLVRKNNEDNFWCDGQYLPCENHGKEDIFSGTLDSEKFPTFAVFDGMGGEECGDIAAFLAAEGYDHLQEQWLAAQDSDAEDYIEGLFQTLNDSVCSYACKNGISTMGTTAAILLFHNRKIFASNVGDSRIYQLQDHKLKQISEDHTYRSAFYSNPPLTQFLGIPREEMLLSPHIQKVNLRGETKFLLCSDGLTHMFTDKEIEDIVNGNDSISEAVSYLQKETMNRGAWDNTTIILCSVRN